MPDADQEKVNLFGASGTALTGTQYMGAATDLAGTAGKGGIALPHAHSIGIIIVHPAATTTQYTVEVSNDKQDEVMNGGDDDWAAYDLIAIPSKSAAETFGILLSNLPFARARIKAVTSAGSGVAKGKATIKAWG